MEVEIDRAIFNKIYIPHLDNMARTQIFYGGSSSGKSVFLAQRCVMDLLKGGRNYLVTRQVARTVRTSVFAEIVRVIMGWGLLPLFDIKESDMRIVCTNGYQAMFAGLDDVEKLKSLVPPKGAITDLWIEEATEADRNTVKQLYKRQRGGDEKIPKRLTMSFNPILQSHWIYQDYFSGIAWADSQTEYYSDELSIQKTWYTHNRFLTQDDIKDLENETDKYFYSVYTLGNWGVLGNVIFTNWSVEDLSEMRDQFTNRRNGLDFGFSSDPAAISLTHYDRPRKTIYILDELYERGLTNDILADRAKHLLCSEYVGKDQNNELVHISKRAYVSNRTEFDGKYADIQPFDYKDLLVCDSAEPKSIVELQGYGLNAIGARKGKDSVLFGIQWLQQQKIVIHKDCVNHINEYRQFHWKEDKDGNAIRQPVDKNDHLISADRYAYEDESMGGVTVVPNPFYDN